MFEQAKGTWLRLNDKCVVMAEEGLVNRYSGHFGGGSGV